MPPLPRVEIGQMGISPKYLAIKEDLPSFIHAGNTVYSTLYNVRRGLTRRRKGGEGDEYRQVLFPQSTQSGNGHFLAYIPSWWKNWWGWGGARPPPFTISTITYKAVVYAPAKRSDTQLHIPYFYYTFICTLWLFPTQIFSFYSQGATRCRQILSSRF